MGVIAGRKYDRRTSTALSVIRYGSTYGPVRIPARFARGLVLQRSPTNAEWLIGLKHLKLVRRICDAKKSIAIKTNFGCTVGIQLFEYTQSYVPHLLKQRASPDASETYGRKLLLHRWFGSSTESCWTAL